MILKLSQVDDQRKRDIEKNKAANEAKITDPKGTQSLRDVEYLNNGEIESVPGSLLPALTDTNVSPPLQLLPYPHL